MKDRLIGTYFLIINGIIIAMAGILYEPENALYTMLTLYITTLVIDAIHTRHEKVTAMIITRKAPALQKAIHEKLVRGITILPRSEEHTSELQSRGHLVCRLLLEKKNI